MRPPTGPLRERAPRARNANSSPSGPTISQLCSHGPFIGETSAGVHCQRRNATTSSKSPCIQMGHPAPAARLTTSMGTRTLGVLFFSSLRHGECQRCDIQQRRTTRRWSGLPKPSAQRAPPSAAPSADPCAARRPPRRTLLRCASCGHAWRILRRRARSARRPRSKIGGAPVAQVVRRSAHSG